MSGEKGSAQRLRGARRARPGETGGRLLASPRGAEDGFPSPRGCRSAACRFLAPGINRDELWVAGARGVPWCWDGGWGVWRGRKSPESWGYCNVTSKKVSPAPVCWPSSEMQSCGRMEGLPARRCGRGSEGEPPEPALPASFAAGAAAALPAPAAGRGRAAMRADRSCTLSRGCWVWARSRAATREAAAGQRGCRRFPLVVPLLSPAFWLENRGSRLPPPFFVPSEVSHALRAVPPGSARTGPSGGAARRGAEALPGRGSRQRALLFRQRQGARLCPAAAGCGPARALSAPNRTSAQSGAGFSIPSDFLSFFSFLFPPFLFSVN